MNLQQRSHLFGELAERILSAVKNSEFAEEMAYLYETMPLSDAANYPPELFESFAEHGRFLRENVEWCRALPEELYRSAVLYPRINDEELCDCRPTFYQLLAPLVEGKSMEEAAKIINYWCLEQATYRLTDERTTSPLTVLRCAFGRCGEESTFTVTALRSVGIPARQVYSPKWPHCDDNHAWVEVFCDGEWHYLGACEPEETLDRGWFTAAASRAMLVHSRTFGDSAQNEMYIGEEGCMSLWNQLSRYADCKELTVKIAENGQPVEGVLVKTELLNYAQFSPIARQLSAADGQVKLTVGLGDLRLHCVKDGRFLTKFVDVRKENFVEIDFAEAVFAESEKRCGADFEMNPPQDNMNFMKPQSEEVKLLRQEKFDKAVAKRREKEASYLTAEQGRRLLAERGFSEEQAILGGDIIAKTYGNEQQILDFLGANDENSDLRFALLETLSEKDYYDCRADVLNDAFDHALQWKDKFPREVFVKYLLCPRVGMEILSPWRKAHAERFSEAEKADFVRAPRTIAQWIQKNISHIPQEEYDTLLTNPLGLQSMKHGSKNSCSILFVAICRSLGIPARLAVDDGRPQFWSSDSQQFEDALQSEENGVRIPFVLTTNEEEPWLYTQNWTLARLENGEYLTLDLSAESWQNNQMHLDLLEGSYRLITCKRMPTEALFAKEYRFDVVENGENTLHIAQREAKLTDLLSDKPIPDFVLYDENHLPVSMAEFCGNQPNLLMWLEEGKEPTEHILNEMYALHEGFHALQAQITFVVKSAESLKDARISRAISQIPNIRILYDDFRDTMSMLARRMYIDPDKLPIVVLTSHGLNGIYGSSGYNVGLGDLIIKIFSELNQ